MNEFEKAKKNLKNDMIFLFILGLIGCGYSMYIGELYIFSIILTVFLFIGFILSKNGSRAAGILGIIVGILMIMSGSIIDILLGIFVTIHSIKYNKYCI